MDGGRMVLEWNARDDYALSTVTVQYRYSTDNATWTEIAAPEGQQRAWRVTGLTDATLYYWRINTIGRFWIEAVWATASDTTGSGTTFSPFLRAFSGTSPYEAAPLGSGVLKREP